MSATTLTAKAVKKTTTKKSKSDARAAELNAFEARELGLADAAIEAARAKAKDFVALRALVECWAPLRLEEARLEAAHSFLDNQKAEIEVRLAAEKAWHDARRATCDSAAAILGYSPWSTQEALAKVEAYEATLGQHTPQEADEDGDTRAMLEALVRDVRADARNLPVYLDLLNLAGGGRAPEGPGGAALRSLQARWQSLSAELEAHADEDLDRLAKAINDVERAIMALPCSGPEVAQAKLLEVLKGIEFGETGGEEAALGEVIDWLGAVPGTTQDDLALIALDVELADLIPQLLAKQDEIDGAVEAACDQALAELGADACPSALFARRGEIEVENGMSALTDAIKPMQDRLGEIERQQLGHRATTLAGLRPKARLAAYWRSFDPDTSEIDSLVRDAAILCGLSVDGLSSTPRDLFDEYEFLGGKITALEGVASQPWIGVLLAPPSTRSREIEALLTRDMCREMLPLARDAYGPQPWLSDDEVIKLKPARGGQ